MASWSCTFVMVLISVSIMISTMEIIHGHFRMWFRIPWIFEFEYFCNAISSIITAQQMMFSIKDLFGKSALWIWSHLLKKSLIEKFMFCAMYVFSYWQNQDTNDKRQNHFAWQSKITFLLGFFSVKYSTEYATE